VHDARAATDPKNLSRNLRRVGQAGASIRWDNIDFARVGAHDGGTWHRRDKRTKREHKGSHHLAHVLCLFYRGSYHCAPTRTVDSLGRLAKQEHVKRCSADSDARTYAPRMRDIDTIDSELHLTIVGLDGALPDGDRVAELAAAV
jgi:hypothetical protein